MRPNGIIIAIDGPTASGKSTTAKHVAEKLGYRHLNTGAMYRAFALYAKQNGIGRDDLTAVVRLLDAVEIGFTPDNRVTVHGEDVSKEIVQPEIATLASAFSSLTPVRTKLVDMQRQLGADGGVVLEGRDIGSVVFPDAELKIFLVADPIVRAKRRKAELESIGTELSLEELADQIAERDERDSKRAASPLKKTEDAIELDTSDLTITEQVERIYQLATERAKS